MLADILNVIIWAGGVQSLVLMALLLTRRENRTANRYLAALLLTFSGQGLLIAYGNRAFDLAHPHLTRISWVLPLLLSPAFYLYVRKLTLEDPRHEPKDALHFLPAAGPGVDYGLALQYWSVGNRAGWGHAGQAYGFQSWMIYFPQEGVHLVLLVNLSNRPSRESFRELVESVVP